MKKATLSLLALLFATFWSFGQNTSKQNAEKYISLKGELTFTFQANDVTDIESLTKSLSIVHFDSKTNIIKAWANEKQFRAFEEKGIAYQVPKDENEVDPDVIYDVTPFLQNNKNNSGPDCPGNPTTPNPFTPQAVYPTYAGYAQRMQDFQTNNPTLVETFSIGSTGEGDKELLFVKISDNVSTDEQEPKLMLTSSMHGDEIAGYPMMLSLIDYILVVYADTGHADHARVKYLVENTELWINPSANPDGTYYNSAGNTSVTGSRRANANNVDLNRNYPDNVQGAHPDGLAYQTETLAFMCLADENNFVLAANFHGGTELVNYPFDNAYTAQYTHPDTDWFENVSVEYATHAQTDANAGLDDCGNNYNYKSDYMTEDDDWDESDGNQAWHNDYSQSPGVTHGAEWYRVYGGRQDYMTVYKHCREVTIELSDVKILPESSLLDYWYYNRDALLDYLTQGTYGFTGIVKDATTGNPIEAKVTIVGHDAYGSEVYTDITHGDFYRPIQAGTYNILIESACYQSQTLTNQTIADGQRVTLADVMMVSSGSASTPTNMEISSITDTSAYVFWDTTGNNYDLRYRIVGTTPWTTITNLNESAYAITGLALDTEYEVQTTARCGSSSSTAYTSIETFKTTGGYCDSNGQSTNDEYIDRVQLGTLDNNNSGVGTTSTGYSNFKNIVTIPDLTVGNTYPITITPEWSGQTYPEGYTVWIDYNRNGDFSDTGELVYTKTASTDATATGNIVIPNGLTAGNTTMRVSMKWNGVPTECESFSYGEVEDYTINLVIGTLSVEENNLEELSVYPNPFNNEIDIKFPNTLNGLDLDIQLYDMSGRLITQMKNDNLQNNTLKLTNLGRLSEGTYFLKITEYTSGITITKKVVK